MTHARIWSLFGLMLPYLLSMTFEDSPDRSTPCGAKSDKPFAFFGISTVSSENHQTTEFLKRNFSPVNSNVF